MGMNKDKIEMAVAISGTTISMVAATVESVIKDRAIFKKDGISESEKKAGRIACYTKWISYTAATACSVDMVQRAVKTAAEEAIEIGKEVI